jgi:polar amino acid transport system substrate-binding protein
MQKCRLLVLVVLSSLIVAWGVPVAAQDEAPLRVAIKPLTPFVFYNEDGSYSGFSIDLWEAIATRANRSFEYVPFDTVAEVLDAVRAGQADVGIAGISITSEREEVLDFSQPMFNAGLRILVSNHGDSDPLAVLQNFFSPTILLILGIVLVVVIVVGHIVWIFERKNPDFPDDYLPGVAEGIWWAASSLLNSGDKMPRSVAGRFGAIVWVLTGIGLIAFFTANLTASNTINQLQSNIRGLDDLPGKRIATVMNTTSADYLTAQRLIFTPVETIEEAYALMDDGRIDAIVYDSPVLQYYAITEGRGRVEVTGSIFARQDYGIAFQQYSRLREATDLALLGILEDGTYDTLYTQWFGQD